MRRFLFLALIPLLCLAACQTTPPAPAAGPPPAVAEKPSGGVAAPPAPEQPKTAPGRAASETSTPAPTSTPRPTNTPAATATRTPTPSPSPTPAPQTRRLTDGECCSAPSWSADSSKVIYLDKPAPDAPTGYYAIDVTRPNAQPELFQSRIAQYTGDFKYITTRGDGFATVERVEDGKVFRINTGRCGTQQPTGCQVNLSPDRTMVTWSVTAEATGPFEQRHTRLWLANIDGSNPRVIANLLSSRAGASWFPDSKRLLLSGRPGPDTQELILSVLDLADGSVKEMVRGERINRGQLSPDGKWLVYTIILGDDEDQNGIWLIRTDGSEKRKLPFFGPLSWRSATKILYTPQVEAADSHTFFEYDVETGQMRALTDPQTTPFKISFGDWALSPDGKRVVYVEARDRNLWLLDLPN